jgi:hypothetical protein
MARMSTAAHANHERRTLTTTTTAENLNFAQPAPMPALYKRELPDSQDSYVSAASSTFSAPQLPSSSSNLSVSTVGDTDLVNSSTLIAPPEQAQCTERAKPESPKRVRRLDAPLRVDAVPAPRTGDTAASPMSLDSPVAQGFKRSADGAVKGSTTTADTSAKPASGHKRPKSMDAGRIGEVRARHGSCVVRVWLTYLAAIGTAKDAPFVCHGQSAERLGEAVARRAGRAHVSAGIPTFGDEQEQWITADV